MAGQSSVIIYGIEYKTLLNPFSEWDKATKAFEDLDQRNAHKKSSFVGRIRTVQTYFLCLLWYRTWIQMPPKEEINWYEDIMKKFVFGESNGRIAKQKAEVPVKHGGLGLPDIYNRILAQRLMFLIRRFSSIEQKSWFPFFDFYYARSFRTNNVPSFYLELRHALRLIRFEQIDNGCILFNGGQKIHMPTANVKIVYEKIQEIWLNDTIIQIPRSFPEMEGQEIIFNLTNFPYVPGAAKDIHFNFYGKRIFVNSKLSINQARISEYGKHCAYCVQSNVIDPPEESTFHLFIQCPRSAELWSYVEHNVRRLIDQTPFENVHKIFGFRKSIIGSYAANYMIIIAQMTVVIARKHCYSGDPVPNLIELFIKIINKQILKAFVILPRYRFLRLFCHKKCPLYCEDKQDRITTPYG
jgi:hypothetical protein